MAPRRKQIVQHGFVSSVPQEKRTKAQHERLGNQPSSTSPTPSTPASTPNKCAGKQIIIERRIDFNFFEREGF